MPYTLTVSLQVPVTRMVEPTRGDCWSAAVMLGNALGFAPEQSTISCAWRAAGKSKRPRNNTNSSPQRQAPGTLRVSMLKSFQRQEWRTLPATLLHRLAESQRIEHNLLKSWLTGLSPKYELARTFPTSRDLTLG